MKTIKRFLYPIVLDPWLYVRGFFMYAIWPINPIAHILFLQKITYALEIWNKQLFNNTLLYYIIFITIYEILNYSFRNWGRVEIAEKTQQNIHSYYIKKFIKLDNNKIESIWSGRLISIIEKWLLDWWKILNVLFFQWIPVIFSLVFTIYMLFSLNYLYWLVFLFIYIVFHIIWYYLNNNMIKYRNWRIEEKHNYAKHLIKIIMSKFEILQSHKVDREILHLDNFSENMIKANRKMVPFLHTFFMLPEAIILILKVWIFWFLWTKVLNWEISISVLVWLSGAILLMDRAIDTSLELFKNITKNFYTISSMWKLFDNTKTIKWYDNWKDFKYISWEMKLKNINFWYNKTKKVFKNFNLKIKWWKITAFVWNSWWWKSTLIKLLSGYIKVDSWEVIIDGQKLSEISLKSYYKNIWYLTQEPSVFDWTVLENLTYAIDSKFSIIQFNKGDKSKDVWQKHLKKILKLAKCEFIYDLPKWINTQIWERWVKLSWWQKQRLAIAKIFLKNPKIILLDEPTSALDSFSEEQITKAMRNLFKKRTVVIIAHRLQTVKYADKIFVLEHWEVKEEGTHKELIKQKWVYKKMLDLQSGF